MKQAIYFILGLVFAFSVASISKQQQSEPCVIKKNTAEVEFIQGFYVFTDSKPSKEFTYLGTVKGSASLSSQYEPVRNRLLKKGREEFKDGDGIIIHLVNGGWDKADVIKFKE